MLAEAACYYHGQGKNLFDVLYDIFTKTGAFYDSQFSIMLPGADGAAKLQQIMSALREKPFSIPGYNTLKIEDYKLRKTTYADGHTEELNGFDLTDALKYYLDDGSFIAIRPSGTEPKCKFYLSTKADTYEAAVAKVDEFKDVIRAIVK